MYQAIINKKQNHCDCLPCILTVNVPTEVPASTAATIPRVAIMPVCPNNTYGQAEVPSASTEKFAIHSPLTLILEICFMFAKLSLSFNPATLMTSSNVDPNVLPMFHILPGAPLAP